MRKFSHQQRMIPDSFRVKYVYNNLGELSYIYDDSNNDLICEIGRNRFRKHAKRILGNQTGISYIYNSLGMITNITSGNLDSNPPPEELNTDDNSSVSYSIGDQYRNLTYTYNTIGLIDSRKDSRINQYETYIYDKQDRLTDFNVGTIQPFTTNLVTYGINAWGNITTNTLVGDYSYTSEKPYAVWRIIPNTKCTISPSTCESKFNNLNLPSTIVEGKYSYAIDYGSDGNRRSAVLTKTENGSTTTVKTTRYISPSCEIEISPSGTKYIDYIMTDQGVVAIRTKAGTQQNLYYVHTDHLGSYNFVMDASKNIVQSCHFDPWGNRKLYNNWTLENTATSFLFSRGYTSHEHLDVFKIINMNARLYDPVIGRFFSPDPIIQDYEATQTLNRYSYCQNNPVNRVDVTGMKDKEWDDDYFDKTGKYLGSDNAKTGEIRIIETNEYESIKKLSQKYGEHKDDVNRVLLQKYSSLVKNVSLDRLSKLNILNHYYSEAGFNLLELENSSIDPNPNKTSYSQWYPSLAKTEYGPDYNLGKGVFRISIDVDLLGITLINKYDIISVFMHERGGHGIDFLKAERAGKKPYYSQSDSYKWELRACKIQLNDPSWMLISPEFKNHMMSVYGYYLNK